jgi:aromatic ring-cleaving dioxygenase
MPQYNVEWTMDIYADDEAGAAQEAWDALRRRHSIANVFEVSDGMGMTTRVDLGEHDPEMAGVKVWMPNNTQIADLAEWMLNDCWGIDEVVEMVRRPHKYAQQYTAMVIEREFGKVAKEPEIEDTDDDDSDETTPEGAALR